MVACGVVGFVGWWVGGVVGWRGDGAVVWCGAVGRSGGGWQPHLRVVELVDPLLDTGLVALERAVDERVLGMVVGLGSHI